MVVRRSIRLILAQLDVQVAQLLFFDGGRRAHHQILGLLGLGEGDDLADGRFVGQNHGDAVDARGDTTVGRRTKLKGFEHMPKLEQRRFAADAEQVEQFLLHVALVDTNRAAGHFVAVEHQVVGFGADFTRVGIHQAHIAVEWSGEGVMGGVPTIFALVPFQQREVENPGKFEQIGVG